MCARRRGVHPLRSGLAWPQRTRGVEGAGGTGHSLAQQLLAAGERVLDVPPKLGTGPAAGSRELNKNDAARQT